jgi:predicted alpha/beta-fold hydrolase
MDEGRVIRMSWNEWKAGRASKRAVLALHGLAGDSRRTSARPEARRQLQVLLERMPDVKTSQGKG